MSDWLIHHLTRLTSARFPELQWRGSYLPCEAVLLQGAFTTTQVPNWLIHHLARFPRLTLATPLSCSSTTALLSCLFTSTHKSSSRGFSSGRYTINAVVWAGVDHKSQSLILVFIAAFIKTQWAVSYRSSKREAICKPASADRHKNNLRVISWLPTETKLTLRTQSVLDKWKPVFALQHARHLLLLSFCRFSPVICGWRRSWKLFFLFFSNT